MLNNSAWIQFLKNLLSLFRSGALPLLIDLIANSKEDNVREQCLWALGNISADVNDCRDVLLDAGILPPLLWQLGINSPPHRRCISPSLFTMRHVTWTCSNLVRYLHITYSKAKWELYTSIALIWSETCARLLNHYYTIVRRDSCCKLKSTYLITSNNHYYRGTPPPPFEIFKAIVYAFAELLHSPVSSF